VLQVCLNGARTRAEHPALPISAAELARAATEAVAAGATDIHLHPKTPDGNDSMAATEVAAAVDAVRSAVPGVAVGVTTGAWTASTVERIRHIHRWTVLPDHASVNWHEDGAEEVAQALLARSVAVHAGVFSGTDGADRLRRSPLRDRVARILAEVIPPAIDVDQLLASLPGSAPVLLHGEDSAAWPVLWRARALGLDARIGFEDTLMLPDGAPAPSNAALVHAALTAQ
jgi:uncharacterized protein (DUF849 family)